jgi:hypothetical protein
VPPDSSFGTAWRQPEFDDSSWTAGFLGVGYERSSGYGAWIGTDVEQEMYNQNATVCIRIPFSLADIGSVTGLTLEIQYDDGFAAFLGGTKVAEANAPASLSWNSAATSDHPDSQSKVFQSFPLDSHLSLLREGTNILAVHGLNRNTTSSDMLVRARLVATRTSSSTEPGPAGYFSTPTPGAPNIGDFTLDARVAISVASRTFFSPLSVALSGAGPGQTIRYTLDGTPPGIHSPTYSAPLSIAATTQIRAKIFDASGASGPTSTETYLYLAEDLRGFKSNLPIVVLDNFGARRPNSKTTMFMAVIKPGEDGIAEITDPFQVATRGTMKVRGSSSSGWPKYSMTIEAWDGDDQDQDIAPLDLPPEADWVLISKYRFDRALMRNDLAYQLSRDLGDYASRTRHVEVLDNTAGGSLSYARAYFGVYSLAEKIKRDKNRVDIAKLEPGDLDEPEISGGYIFKQDRQDPGDTGFTVDGFPNAYYGKPFSHVYPKESDMPDAQKNWLVAYLNEYKAAVGAPDWTNPTTGKHFTEYIDVDSWLHHHWINTLAMNVDGFRLSGYLYKDRLGKLRAGPVGDFDRAMNSTDRRDDNPEAWDGGGDSSKTWYDSRYPWWGEALANPDFRQLHTDLWQRERDDGGVFSWAHIEGLIDFYDTILNTPVSNTGGIASTAQARNFAKWTQMPPRNGSHASEVTILKNWLQRRLAWIDSQYTARPGFLPAPGLVAAGTDLSFDSAATVYYTTDGTDPRAPGGGVSPAASTTLPLTIGATTIVTARARIGTGLTSWSGPVRGTFLVGPVADASNLVVTEVHYAPRPPESPEELAVSDDPADFEFVELQNISDTETIDLTDVRFAAGFDFTFTGSSITTLAPGERVLVVRNPAAFEARYGASAAARIAGAYAPDRLDNDGERILLLDALGGMIADFTYNDKHPWPEEAGFPGYSLVLASTAIPNPDYTQPSNWRTSTLPDGNPDASDASPLVGPPAEDKDRDGVTNLFEHAFGTSDENPAEGRECYRTAFQPIEVDGATDEYFTITWRRNLAADDVELVPEFSEDLGTWHPGDTRLVFVSETNQGDGTSLVTWRVAAPAASSPRAFLRLRAAQR